MRLVKYPSSPDEVVSVADVLANEDGNRQWSSCGEMMSSPSGDVGGRTHRWRDFNNRPYVDLPVELGLPVKVVVWPRDCGQKNHLADTSLVRG